MTGTRAEFGLMRLALEAIRAHRRLHLQIIATGMHLDPRHGKGLDEIQRQGFSVDARIDWPPGGSPAQVARSTGGAIAGIAAALEELSSDIVLVVGDRAEAFAGAAAGQLSQRVLAHVHGGDRALGQVDDSLRHAITKLSHLHFPATAQSAKRLKRLGEQSWRIHRIGSPGLDGIRELALKRSDWPVDFSGLSAGGYGLVLLHPAEADERLEQRRAKMILASLRRAGIERLVLVYPNNDPGAGGIIRQWNRESARALVREDISRPLFLGLLRDAALLAGNSSSGIIEAATFGTSVLDIGPRQLGRERSRNVIHSDYDAARIEREAARIWNRGNPQKNRCVNVYGRGGAGQRMADILARVQMNSALLRKIIAY